MTHDPFQSYAMLGAYPGVPAFQPFAGQQNYGQYSGLNPLAIHQQLQQLSAILAAQTNPWQGIAQFQVGQHNPFGGFQQLPLAALQNPLIAAALQNPLVNPLLAQTMAQHLQQAGFAGTPFGQTGTPYGQTGTPYGQTGTPFGQTGMPFGQTGYPLAPQSWIGQQGQLGQIHPLYQQLLAQRGLAGINPWGY